MAHRRWTGFTLAELLIALAILAEIATFTIPKILTSQQNGHRKAVLKETIGALSQVVYNSCINPSSTQGLSEFGYWTSQLNTVKQCPNNSLTEGCTAASAAVETDGAGFTLHNGAAVVGFENVVAWGVPTNNGFMVDWNGLDGPNILGEDQFWLGANYRLSPTWGDVKMCTVGPIFNTALTEYGQIFE